MIKEYFLYNDKIETYTIQGFSFGVGWSKLAL